MKIFLKIVLNLGLLSILLLLAGLFLAKPILHHKAEKKAENILAQAPEFESRAQRLVYSTLAVYNRFTPAQEVKNTPFLLKLKPYVTNRRLPDLIRVDHGVFETLYPQGWCNDASRMLVYLLEQQGIEASIWNMVSPVGGHVAVSAYIPEIGNKFLDPTYGVIALYADNAMLGPYQAQEVILSGAYHTDVFKKLTDDSNLEFYEHFDEVMMGKEGDVLNINLAAPVFREPLKLGEIDGKSEDVQAAAIAQGLTPHIDYLGHKYDRNWNRSFYFTDDARFTIVLADDYDPGVMTANMEPKIDGRSLSWDIPLGEQIIFDDSKAKLSLKRLNSYIPIDQIIIEPLNAE